MLIVQTTVAAKKQAGKIASALVKERLAACATFFPATSLFYWKGNLRRQKEFVVELKIKEGNYKKVEKRILALHPYSLPQVIALPVEKGYGRYLRWAGK